MCPTRTHDLLLSSALAIGKLVFGLIFILSFRLLSINICSCLHMTSGVLQLKPPYVSCQVILSCAYLPNICILHEVPVPDDVEDFMRAEPASWNRLWKEMERKIGFYLPNKTVIVKRKSSLNHIQNIHEHDDPVFPKCGHDITSADENIKIWVEPRTYVHSLKAIFVPHLYQKVKLL